MLTYFKYLTTLNNAFYIVDRFFKTVSDFIVDRYSVQINVSVFILNHAGEHH